MTAAAPTFPPILLPSVNMFITLFGISVGCLNKRQFHRMRPISHVQRLIILDVVMICRIISYLFFYSKLDWANSCQYTRCFIRQCSECLGYFYIHHSLHWLVFLQVFCFLKAFSHTGAPYVNSGSIAPLYIAFSALCPKPHLSLADLANMISLTAIAASTVSL